MTDHVFTLKGTWKGGLNGEGTIDVGSLKSAISIPTVMQGPGKGTNPEEMMLGAAATCYLITLAAILERRKIKVTSLTLTSEGVYSVQGGLKVQSITHRPVIQVAPETTETELTTVREATERAERACMISNAIRGNVTVTVEPQLTR